MIWYFFIDVNKSFIDLFLSFLSIFEKKLWISCYCRIPSDAIDQDSIFTATQRASSVVESLAFSGLTSAE
jgi:hypothetical protein